MLTFEIDCNTDFKLIYKPRSINNENFFNTILAWYNNKNRASPVKLIEVSLINQSSHGWIEFIEQKNCKQKSEVEHFYESLGVLTCFSYLVCLHDLHYENLIAHQSYPFISDLECIGPEFSALYEDEKIYAHNVLKSGMMMSFVFERNAALDMSAFAGGGPESEIPFQNSYLKNEGRDDAHFDRKGGNFFLQSNRCLLNGKPVNPYHYKRALLRGFNQCYDIVLNKKCEFIKLIKDNLYNIQTRVIFRPTAYYSKLITESFHPILLRHPKKYSEHINHLALEKLLVSLDHTLYERVVRSELDQINNDDIPLFYLRDNILLDAYDNVLLKNIHRSVPNYILAQLENISNCDKEKQLSLLSKNIDLYPLNYSKKKTNRNTAEHQPLDQIDTYKKQAEVILDDMLKQRIVENEWIWPEHKVITHRNNDKKYWTLVGSEHNLYSGSIGILLVMCYWEKVTNGRKYISLLEQAVHHLILQLQLKTEIEDLSAFSGIASYAYLGAHLLDIGFEDTLVRVTLEKIEENIDNWLSQFVFDIISGVAGLLLILETLAKKQLFNKRVVNLINKCINWVLIFYKNPSRLPTKAQNENSKVPVVGFSHGLSGIAYSLIRVSSYLETHSKIHVWVSKALKYERKKFSLKYQNWPNTYLQQKEPSLSVPEADLYQINWCHGSLGIGMARLEFMHLGQKDLFLESELSVCIASLQRSYRQKEPLNLCHGSLGVLDFYLQLMKSGLLDKDIYESERQNFIKSLRQNVSFATEFNKKIYIPGLMTGQAGIVYMLLRIAYPNKIPCILNLE